MRNTRLLSGTAAAFYSAGIDPGAASGVLVDGLEITRTRPAGPRSAGPRHLENATLRNVVVDGTPAGTVCLLSDTPPRGVVLENLALCQCGGRGIAENLARGSRADPDTGSTFRNVTVRTVDAANTQRTRYAPPPSCPIGPRGGSFWRTC